MIELDEYETELLQSVENEVAKIRPALILQNNSRDKLQKNSDILIAPIRAIPLPVCSCGVSAGAAFGSIIFGLGLDYIFSINDIDE